MDPSPQTLRRLVNADLSLSEPGTDEPETTEPDYTDAVEKTRQFGMEPPTSYKNHDLKEYYLRMSEQLADARTEGKAEQRMSAFKISCRV